MFSLAPLMSCSCTFLCYNTLHPCIFKIECVLEVVIWWVVIGICWHVLKDISGCSLEGWKGTNWSINSGKITRIRFLLSLNLFSFTCGYTVLKFGSFYVVWHLKGRKIKSSIHFMLRVVKKLASSHLLYLAGQN